MTIKIQKHQNDKIIEFQWNSDNPQIPKPLPTSCFLVDGLLIDSGAPGGAIELYNALITLPDDLKVRACYVTHFHEDHAGGSSLLHEKLGIPIYTGKETIPILEKGYSYRLYRQIYWGYSGLQPVKAQVSPSPLHTPGENYCFTLFPMPGHAPDLIALIEKEKQWLFVADAVLSRYTTLFGGSSPDLHENIEQIHDSHKKILQFTEGMDHLQVYLAHQGIFTRQLLIEKVDEIKKLHQNAHRIRNQLFAEGVVEERKQFRKIIREMFGDESPAAGMSQGEMSRENLIRSLLEWPLS
jgi:glyoxylase-like metal-dependent hydrolase (beta-lactamase superfamily II)